MKMRATRSFLYAAALLGAATIAVAQTPVKQKAGPEVTTQGVLVKPSEPTSKNDPHVVGPFKPTDPDFRHLTFETNVGSFKLVGSDPVKAQGTLEFSFKGTVLVSDPDPQTKVTLTGAVAKEFENDDKTKQVYFGTGKIRIVGRIRALQFFGQNVRGNFYGLGIFRFYGEFDKNLHTGTYQYENGQKTPWPAGGGQQVTVGPSAIDAQTAKVKVKKAGG